MPCPFFLLRLTTISQPRVFFFLQGSVLLPPHRWLRDFVEKSSTPFCTLIIFCQSFLHLSMHLLHFSSSISSSRAPAIHTIFAWYPPILWVHAFSQSFASNSETHQRFLASMLPFDLIFFASSFMMVILCCCFISSSSVSSSCLLCRRCKLYSLNKEKILAQQSSLHFLILFLLFLRTLLHSKGSPLPLKAPLLLSFDFVLVQDFLLHSLSQLLPA